MTVIISANFQLYGHAVSSVATTSSACEANGGGGNIKSEAGVEKDKGGMLSILMDVMTAVWNERVGSDECSCTSRTKFVRI